MHEVALVRSLIETVDRQLADLGVDRAGSIRLRRGSAFSAAALEQAFAALTPGTRLEGAALVVESFDTRFTCTHCGHSQTITCDDLVGHLFLCPACARVQQIDEAHDLQVVELLAPASR